jgi:thioredoxin-like negative regulator of GroEL
MDTHGTHEYVEEVGEGDLEEKVLRPSHDRPVLVDVYSNFCIPCQEILPVVCELAAKYRDQLTVVKINISTAARFRETYLGPLPMTPSFLFFKDGQPLRTGRLARLLGHPAFIASTRAALEKRIRAILGLTDAFR